MQSDESPYPHEKNPKVNTIQNPNPEKCNLSPQEVEDRRTDCFKEKPGSGVRLSVLLLIRWMLACPAKALGSFCKTTERKGNNSIKEKEWVFITWIVKLLFPCV